MEWKSEVQSFKQASINVSKTSTGKFSYDAKIYYDDEIRKGDDVIKELKTIIDTLVKTFEG